MTATGLPSEWPSAPILWFRPSIRRLVWRLWGLAFLWVFLGAACLGALRVMRVDFGSTWLPLYLIGIALVTAGPTQLLFGLQRSVRIERVLSVHEEGLRWQDGASVALVRWDDLDAVEIGESELVLVHANARLSLPREMEGITASELAAMLMDMRQKALLGLSVRLAAPDRT